MIRTVLPAIALTLILAVLPFSAAHSAASDTAAIGTVMEVEGGATITHDGGRVVSELLNGTSVYLNDIIETGADSKALVLFIDDTELTLSADSRLTIDEYVFDPDDVSDNKGRFSVLTGSFLFVSGLLTKKDEPDVRIETQYGSIGLRGTTVWGGDVDGKYGILVNDGEVDVATDRGRMRIGKGQGTWLRNRNTIPARPAAWSPEAIDKAVKTITLARHEQVMQRIAVQKEKHGEMRTRYKALLNEKRGEQRELREQYREQIQKRKELHKGELGTDPQQQRQELRQELRQERRETVKERLEDDNAPALRRLPRGRQND